MNNRDFLIKILENAIVYRGGDEKILLEEIRLTLRSEIKRYQLIKQYINPEYLRLIIEEIDDLEDALKYINNRYNDLMSFIWDDYINKYKPDYILS